MKKELQNLQSQIECIQTQLNSLPEGKLICTRNGNHYKWYQSKPHQITYIPRKNRPLAEQLAIKKYLTYILSELYQKQRAIEEYLKQFPTQLPKSEQLLHTESGYRELLLPHFMPSSHSLSQWVNSPYENNPKYPDQLIHKSISGHYVRSKSEAMIDMYLFTHHIPFRYECALHLNEITLFPDFTIFHPETHKLYYWEHFGRMDDASYAKNVFSKQQIYNSHGIIPGIQLITTYETSDVPLSFDTIEYITSHYFQLNHL